MRRGSVQNSFLASFAHARPPKRFVRLAASAARAPGCRPLPDLGRLHARLSRRAVPATGRRPEFSPLHSPISEILSFERDFFFHFLFLNSGLK